MLNNSAPPRAGKTQRMSFHVGILAVDPPSPEDLKLQVRLRMQEKGQRWSRKDASER